MSCNLDFLAVGGKLDIPITQEGSIFETRENKCFCFTNLKNVHSRIVDAFKTGDIKLSLSYINKLLFLTLNVDGVYKYEMVFNMKLYPEMQLQEIGEKSYSLTFVLVDASSSNIMALRMVSLGNKFSKTLYDCAKDQFDNGHDQFVYNYEVDKTYRMYSMNDIAKRSLTYLKVRRN